MQFSFDGNEVHTDCITVEPTEDKWLVKNENIINTFHLFHLSHFDICLLTDFAFETKEARHSGL